MSVYGNVYGLTQDVTLPDASDVRLGVDRGDGVLGTLVATTVQNITQQVTPAQILGGGGSWYAERTSEFEDLINDDLFGTTLEANGVTFPCIGPPQEQIKKMTLGPYESNRPAQFSMRRTDFVLSGISNRTVMRSNNLTFEVYSYLDDPKEPTVDLLCQLKQ